MLTMAGGVLVGAAAGLYFRVFILVPLTILAFVGMAIVDVVNGAALLTTVFHMARISFALQFAYFGSSFFVTRAPRHACDQIAHRDRALSQAHETIEVVGFQTRRLQHHLEWK